MPTRPSDKGDIKTVVGGANLFYCSKLRNMEKKQDSDWGIKLLWGVQTFFS